MTILEAAMPRSADRKLLILHAATALFARKGYDATTLTEIAQAADSSVGSLMNFYESKPCLALAVRESIVSALADAISAALRKHPEDIETAVAAVHAAYLDWVIAFPEMAALLRNLAGVRVGSPGANENLLARVSEVVEQWATPLLVRGALPTMAPETLLAIILGPVVTLSWFTEPPRLQALACPGAPGTLTGLTLNDLHAGPAGPRLRPGRRPIQREAVITPEVASQKATHQMALAFPSPV